MFTIHILLFFVLYWCFLINNSNAKPAAFSFQLLLLIFIRKYLLMSGHVLMIGVFCHHCMCAVYTFGCIKYMAGCVTCIQSEFILTCKNNYPLCRKVSVVFTPGLCSLFRSFIDESTEGSGDHRGQPPEAVWKLATQGEWVQRTSMFSSLGWVKSEFVWLEVWPCDYVRMLWSRSCSHR